MKRMGLSLLGFVIAICIGGCSTCQTKEDAQATAPPTPPAAKFTCDGIGYTWTRGDMEDELRIVGTLHNDSESIQYVSLVNARISVDPGISYSIGSKSIHGTLQPREAAKFELHFTKLPKNSSVKTTELTVVGQGTFPCIIPN